MVQDNAMIDLKLQTNKLKSNNSEVQNEKSLTQKEIETRIATSIFNTLAKRPQNESLKDLEQLVKVSLNDNKTLSLQYCIGHQNIELWKSIVLDLETFTLQQYLDDEKEMTFWMRRFYGQSLDDLQIIERGIHPDKDYIAFTYRYWYMLMKPGTQNLNNRDIVKGSFRAVSPEMFTVALGMSLTKDQWSHFFIYPDNIRMFLTVPCLSSDFIGQLGSK